MAKIAIVTRESRVRIKKHRLDLAMQKPLKQDQRHKHQDEPEKPGELGHKTFYGGEEGKIPDKAISPQTVNSQVLDLSGKQEIALIQNSSRSLGTQRH